MIVFMRAGWQPRLTYSGYQDSCLLGVRTATDVMTPNREAPISAPPRRARAPATANVNALTVEIRECLTGRPAMSCRGTPEEPAGTAGRRLCIRSPAMTRPAARNPEPQICCPSSRYQPAQDGGSHCRLEMPCVAVGQAREPRRSRPGSNRANRERDQVPGTVPQRSAGALTARPTTNCQHDRHDYRRHVRTSVYFRQEARRP